MVKEAPEKSNLETCLECGDDLPKGSRVSRQYCSDACRNKRWCREEREGGSKWALDAGFKMRAEVGCPTCGADAGEGCDGPPQGHLMHRSRLWAHREMVRDRKDAMHSK